MYTHKYIKIYIYKLLLNIVVFDKQVKNLSNFGYL